MDHACPFLNFTLAQFLGRDIHEIPCSQTGYPNGYTHVSVWIQNYPFRTFGSSLYFPLGKNKGTKEIKALFL
jgi:hypothetical protein